MILINLIIYLFIKFQPGKKNIFVSKFTAPYGEQGGGGGPKRNYESIGNVVFVFANQELPVSRRPIILQSWTQSKLYLHSHTCTNAHPLHHPPFQL